MNAIQLPIHYHWRRHNFSKRQNESEKVKEQVTINKRYVTHNALQMQHVAVLERTR